MAARILALATATVCACALLAGCSDDPTQETTATTETTLVPDPSGETAALTDSEALPGALEPTADSEITVAAFIAAADAICSETNDVLATLPDPSTPDELAQGVRQGKEIAERQLARLRALPVPEEVAEPVARAYDVIAEQVGLLDAVAEAAERSERGRLEELIAQLDALDAEADALATQIGLVECGNDDG